ncbi:MAG: hypothetical protein K2X01_06410 [Cyanobacteria bacterium]|nr:hypothetical protein [Cyanobacteriota bacterium]
MQGIGYKPQQFQSSSNPFAGSGASGSLQQARFGQSQRPSGTSLAEKGAGAQVPQVNLLRGADATMPQGNLLQPAQSVKPRPASQIQGATSINQAAFGGIGPSQSAGAQQAQANPANVQGNLLQPSAGIGQGNRLFTLA